MLQMRQTLQKVAHLGSVALRVIHQQEQSFARQRQRIGTVKEYLPRRPVLLAQRLRRFIRQPTLAGSSRTKDEPNPDSVFPLRPIEKLLLLRFATDERRRAIFPIEQTEDVQRLAFWPFVPDQGWFI